MKKCNEGFICIGCDQTIPPAVKTCRNHCTTCFLSLHVDDEVPGDRKSMCKGQMIPVRYSTVGGTIKIYFVCVDCGHSHRNKVAPDDDITQLETSLDHWKDVYRSVYIAALDA